MPRVEVYDRADAGRWMKCAACGVTTDRFCERWTPDPDENGKQAKRRYVCGLCWDRGYSFDLDTGEVMRDT